MIDLKRTGRGLLTWLRKPASPWFVGIGILIFIVLGAIAITTGKPWSAAFCGLVVGYAFICDIIPAIRKSNGS
jgi:hypothetical protein